jgi:hypothetical protein
VIARPSLDCKPQLMAATWVISSTCHRYCSGAHWREESSLLIVAADDIMRCFSWKRLKEQ